jgi:HEAT repeat protein
MMLNLLSERKLAMKMVKAALEVDLFLGAQMAGAVDNKFQENALQFVIASEAALAVKIYLLEMTKSRWAIPFLLKIYFNDVLIRSRVVDALGEIGSTEAIPHLVKFLRDDIVNINILTLVGKIIVNLQNKYGLYNPIIREIN